MCVQMRVWMRQVYDHKDDDGDGDYDDDDGG